MIDQEPINKHNIVKIPFRCINANEYDLEQIPRYLRVFGDVRGPHKVGIYTNFFLHTSLEHNLKHGGLKKYLIIVLKMQGFKNVC